MAEGLILAGSFLFIGLLMVGLSLPLTLGKIPPNKWYGFRVGKTLSSKRVWYKANKYAAKNLLIAGIIISIGSLVLLPFVGIISFLAIAGIGNVLILTLLIIVLLRAFLYIDKL
ncbi:MAG: SdpI family protein [Nitrospirae bacterium]|nr:SdpI family protein [Nitrospirota bacterium]